NRDRVPFQVQSFGSPRHGGRVDDRMSRPCSMSEPIMLSWIGALHAISEPIVYFWIGALAAGALVLGLRQFRHPRVASGERPYTFMGSPSVMPDIETDMDQLHAQIAVATRRLEISVEQMKLKTTSQLTEIGKSSEAIGRLKWELTERTTAFAVLQEK